MTPSSHGASMYRTQEDKQRRQKELSEYLKARCPCIYCKDLSFTCHNGVPPFVGS